VSQEGIELPRRMGDLGPVDRQRDLPLDVDSENGMRELLNALPAAVYVTDAAGRITFYNEVAAAIWGRRPKLNSDQWCGSWRMYWPDGTPLPHDECPMAVALKEKRNFNGIGQEAVVERPDGTRVPFMAFPSPGHARAFALLPRRRGTRADRGFKPIAETEHCPDNCDDLA
jgi:PAS domain-containing protein